MEGNPTAPDFPGVKPPQLRACQAWSRSRSATRLPPVSPLGALTSTSRVQVCRIQARRWFSTASVRTLAKSLRTKMAAIDLREVLGTFTTCCAPAKGDVVPYRLDEITENDRHFTNHMEEMRVL
jgi:hypothetical protein